MVLENTTMSEVAIIKENGYMEEKKDKAILMDMDKHIMENGQIILKWGLDNILGKMEIDIKEDLFPNLEKEKEHITGKMDKNLKDGGNQIY